ncbi:hypothetical protein KUTeg_008444 [Tegillarca granosa]|uniref:G-protein coupled receptors family 2 profile 2 domain-containing protein n=1 Tax=Tegillarca granosa TaxID=220873 RepID=A0ABQ9F966_TEGGR|nr:hypothetical protein KUTeg_008444 [Tegillarca granosa]
MGRGMLVHRTKPGRIIMACLPGGQSFVLITEHLPKIKLMYNIGYGISLCSLVVAVIIMVCCRRLHSKSNTMHINLFLAFIMRALMSFIKESLFIHGLGLQKDIIKEENGDITFIDEGMHWECKLLYCIFIYGMSVNCMWIFMEALYLHMLVYRTLWTERNGVKMYMVLGWFGPLLFIIPWIIVRATLEDEL